MKHRRKSNNYKEYGINPEVYNDIFNEQKGCCAICGNHQENMYHALAIDHNHKTHEIRGLLCNKCNMAIGALMDDISILENAINYLKKDNSKYNNRNWKNIAYKKENNL